MQTQDTHSQETSLSSSREFCRGTVAITADIRAAGRIRTKVKVLDISQTGFRIECLTFLSGNQSIFLSMPGFEQLESRIIWQTEWMYGCQFVQQLHTAVFDHILRTFPAIKLRQTTNLDGQAYGAAARFRWESSD